MLDVHGPIPQLQVLKALVARHSCECAYSGAHSTVVLGVRALEEQLAGPLQTINFTYAKGLGLQALLPRSTVKMANNATTLKNILLFVIAGACLVWVGWWFLSPDPQTDPKYVDRLDRHIKSRFFRTDGYYGSAVVYQALPMFIVAIVSYAVILLRERAAKASTGIDGKDKNAKTLRLAFGTYPAWVKSPLGVLTAADCLFIATVLLMVVYHLGRTLYLNYQLLDEEYRANPEEHTESKTITKVDYAGYYLGRICMVPFALLWIPVSRGSPFLRLIRVPFEQAVKYHIWLGVLTLFLVCVHSVVYVIWYIGADHVHEMFKWETEGEAFSVLAGWIALAAGIAMWITSLSFCRRKWYEVFFAVHHLYIVFTLFWVYHVPWTVHLVSVPVLLFVVDRFLRFLQSRHSVDILSANVMESGAIELKFARTSYNNNKSLQPVYHALSSWYLRFPSLPKFLGQQWHFFSVMSSPMDQSDELSIVIKPLGGWTNKLRDQLISLPEGTAQGNLQKCPFSFKAAIEGPYGHECAFYLEYKSLVLVAGGIGVTPLLAILRDVLYRYKLHKENSEQGEINLPTSIQLYHCVKVPEELCVLNSVNPLEILPDYENLGLNIQVHAYVTSRNSTAKVISGPRSSPASTQAQTYDLASFQAFRSGSNTISGFLSPIVSARDSRASGLSPISPTGQTIWLASVVTATLVGFYILWGITNVVWIRHYDAKFPGYSRVHILFACMFLATPVFGGAIIIGWYRYTDPRRNGAGQSSMITSNRITDSLSPPRAINLHEIGAMNDEEQSIGSKAGSPWKGTLHLGNRPAWEEVFKGLKEEYDGQNVGVLVSGAAGMQSDIASECRKHTSLNLQLLFGAPEGTGLIFHYHSVSFEL